MTSHNPLRPSYRHATKEEYEAFFRRIEEAFDIEEMTKPRLARWLNNESLADIFSLSREIFTQVQGASSIHELKDLERNARKLLIHKKAVMSLIRERIVQLKVLEEESKVARAITLTNEFAQSKGIILSEKNKGGIYKKWGFFRKPAIVIFGKHGRILTWKYIK